MTYTDDVALLRLQVAIILILHLRFCWKYIRGFVAVFLRFHSMARQLWDAGARARLPTIYFFLPHFGAIKVRRHSLACQMSSGFCVPHLLKLVYFSFYWKKWKWYITFFCNTVYIWPIFCVILHVWLWLTLFRCRFVAFLAPNPGDATGSDIENDSVPTIIVNDTIKLFLSYNQHFANFKP